MNMKAKSKLEKGIQLLIAGNWGLSLCAIGCVDTESTGAWKLAFLFVWFVCASLVLISADRMGLMDGLFNDEKEGKDEEQ
jgi:hypothetical protein